MTTAELRKAQREGAVIVTALGALVTYRPRHKGDRRPWAGPDGYCYPALYCKAVTPNGGGPWSVARLLP